MVISRKHKFIFFAYPKCASTSLNNFLSKYRDLNPKELGIRIQDIPDEMRMRHVSPIHVKRAFRENNMDWDSYFKFMCIRNPWEKVVSNYHSRGKGDKINMSFTQWVKNMKPSDIRPKRLHKWAFEEDHCIVDQIIKVETVNEDMKIICDRIGIPYKRITHQNTSNHKHYSTYYNENTKKIIEKLFYKDIEIGNYVYEGKI